MSVCVDSQSFLARIQQMSELRPFPASATRLITVSNNPDSTIGEMTGIIRNDPALSVNLLRVANSSMYGYYGQIRTIDQAVIVLGIRSVRNLAIAMASTAVFAAGTGSKESRQKLWSHSLGCGCVARMIAKRTGVIPPDEAFLAGVVHDVGKLIFFDLVPEQYFRTSHAASSRTILDREQDEYGTTHQDVGLRCAEQWGLPDEINQAISFHHHPERAEFATDLVELISLANGLAASWGIGGEVTGEDEEEALSATRFEIDAATLSEIREAAPAEFSELAASMT